MALTGDGNTMLVGSEDGGTRRGHVDLLVRAAATWTVQHSFDAAAEGTGFGDDLDIADDGNTVVIGERDGAASRQGVLYFFEKTNGSWNEPVRAISTSIPGELGVSVAISADGSTVLAGEPQLARVVGGQGGAYLYSGSNQWSSVATITNIFGQRVGHFGRDVAISDDGMTLVVSDPGDGASGYIQPYQRGADGEPTLAGFVAQPAAAPHSGAALAMNGNGTLFVTSDINGGVGQRGVVTVFARPGTASTVWAEALLPAPPNSRLFGAAIAVSRDGSVIAVGDPSGGESNAANIVASGLVTLFIR